MNAIVILADVANFIRGITFKPCDVVPIGTPGTIACMRTKNVQSELDMSDVWGIAERFVKREDQYLGVGDILVSSANSWNLVGKCCWVPDLPWRSSFGGFISVLRADPAKVFPRYLFHWFASQRIQKFVRSFGQQTTNISNLNVERCLKLRLPLPSLSNQRRIAEVLDRAEELRAKRRAALAQLDTLTQSIFLDMFGDPATNSKQWPKKLFRELASEFRYGTSNRSQANGKPTLRIPNIIDGSINLTDLKLVPVEPNEFDRLRLTDGDVLFVRTNGNPDFVGRCAVFESPSIANCGFKSDDFIYASYLIQARLHLDRILPVFLREFMLGTGGRRALRARCKTSAGQFNINTDGLGGIEIPVPPAAIQRDFSRSIAKVEKLKVIYRISLAESDSLFASLQHRAFRGEL